MEDKEDEIKQIMLDKLKEMAEIEFDECVEGCDYVNICNIMNEIAKTLLDK